MAAPRIFIDGEAGTTGLGIRARLQATPEVSLISLPAERRRDQAARREAMEAADVAILCLPDEAARDAVGLAEELGARAPRLIDASTAHRVAPGWVYGFAELAPGQARSIATAARVANVGCYAVGAIALLRPLVDAGLLPSDHPLSINAVSGYSGGGKTMIAAHEAEGGPAFELYALGLGHKHVPEIEQHARLSRRPVFVPSVGHFRQGMLVSVPLHLDTLPGEVSLADLRQTLAAHYRGSTRVLVAGSADRLDAEAVAGTDVMEVRVLGDDGRRQAVLVAALDNLGKGASGSAVQNLGLMLGLPLTAETSDA